MINEDEKKKRIKADDMFIDVGAKAMKMKRKMGGKTGTPVTSDMRFKTTGK